MASGPPKQYTSALEARLFETENLLIVLLSQVSDAQLASGFHRLDELRQLRFGFPGVTDDAEVLSYARKNKFEPGYWSEYPLLSVEDVRRWCKDRTRGTVDSGSGQSALKPGLQDDEPVQTENGGPLTDISINYGYAGVQYGEQRGALDQEDYDDRTGMAEVLVEDSSPAELRQTGVPDSVGSTPQRQSDGNSESAGRLSSSSNFDSAYVW